MSGPPYVLQRVKKKLQFSHHSSDPAPPTENPLIPLVIPSVHAPPSDRIYDTIATTPFSTADSSNPSSSSASDGVSQPSASTAITLADETGAVNESATHYSTVDVKPQAVSVPPADDSRVVYAEVNKIQGANVNYGRFTVMTQVLASRSCL